MDNNNNTNNENLEQLALDDERRVKVVSPSMLVFKRFMRNRLAIIGAVIIIIMFIFSFVGGFIMPYGEAQVFTGYEDISREYAHASYNKENSITTRDGKPFSAVVRGELTRAIDAKSEIFTASGIEYQLVQLGESSYKLVTSQPVADVNIIAKKNVFSNVDEAMINEELQGILDTAILSGETSVIYNDVLYTIVKNGKNYRVVTQIDSAVVSKLIFAPIDPAFKLDYNVQLAFETAIANGQTKFLDYEIREHNDSFVVSQNGVDKFAASELIIKTAASDIVLTLDMRTAIADAITQKSSEFEDNGIKYTITGLNGQYTIKTLQSTQLILVYDLPSKTHWMGTDGNGMDILTRLMYGGRISLIIGFVVVIIETILGVILGGMAGYFGGIIDAIIMRLVDIFNCIPSIPLYLILGAVMDGNQVDPQIRIYLLMLIMGLLSWPGVARLVRGQILSLREQEFMVATEACGIRASKRIFKHLIPNVIPQLIVMATMGLGSVILAESTLSFIGMGVKYPFASWGSIIDAVHNIHVMINYPFAWIPAGFLILITVLGFNFIGDGLRDAFDPKMKR